MHSPDNRPFVVGVTGGIGSGKSAVTDFLANLGITIIDADIAARKVVERGQPALQEIAKHFGSQILLKDGQLDRKELRNIIFAEVTEKTWLEQLLHPKINTLIEEQIKQAPPPYVVLVSPLLIETSQHLLVDKVLVVDVPESIQLTRTMTRDNMTEEQTHRIISSQASRKKRLTYADDIIDNSGSLEDLHKALAIYHKQYLKLASCLPAS